tara:strand:- start:116 stop:1021 length:906 start_codon:yes stop_codon:yes gene_type:complete
MAKEDKKSVATVVVKNTDTGETKTETVEMTKEEVAAIENDPATIKSESSDDGDELSPWYYFFAQGCGWCKKSGPVVEELNATGDYPEILMLDTAEPDNAKLRDELFAEYNVRCGTPWFINADTGKHVCGFREKDVLELWLQGEDIPEPPRVTGPMPKAPFQGSTNKENVAWKKEYTKWLKDNEHMPDDWKTRQRSASAIIDGPRVKSDPPQMPNIQQASEADIDSWGEKMKVWQEENKHMPNMQPVDAMVKNIKARQAQMKGAVAQPAGPAVDNAKLNSMDARVQALEVKIDKLMSHFGVK